MVYSKLPNVHTRAATMLQIASMLLLCSVIVNLSLWLHAMAQSSKVYPDIITLIASPEIAEVAEVADNYAAQEPDMVDSKELTCLAENIYHEAAVESELGKIAVAMVTLNRVASNDFPDTICEVVHQPSNAPARPAACQFSWTCDGKSDRIRSQVAYQEIKILARNIMISQGDLYDIVDGALYYHAVYVKPRWASAFEKVARIDTHIFYKNKSDY